MMTRRFVMETAERGVKTAAQSALLLLGADQINALSADWLNVAGFALGGFVISVLTSVASKPLGGDDGSPSVV
jgi:hypothetical protein